MARMSRRRHGVLWFIHMRKSPGVVFHWGVTKGWSQLSASVFCAVGCSTYNLDSVSLLLPPKFTTEALGQCRQNQWCPIGSGKPMCHCRNCFTEYLVWTSISFTSLSLSAGRPTSSASDHSGQDLHDGVWAQSRLCSLIQPGIKHLIFKWSGVFVTRRRVKTEIVCRRECQLGLYFVRRVEALS